MIRKSPILSIFIRIFENLRFEKRNKIQCCIVASSISVHMVVCFVLARGFVFVFFHNQAG